MKPREHVIQHPSQLNRLSLFPGFRTKGLGKLRLGGEMAGHDRKESWEQELNRNYYACGCDTGAAGLLLGILFGGLYAAYRVAGNDWTLRRGVVAAVLVALIATAAGKLYGLLRANRRLKATIMEIKQEWKPPPGRVEANATCG